RCGLKKVEEFPIVRRQHRRDEAHVVEKRQPRQAAVALLTVERLDDLDDVGGHTQVGDLHTRGDARRAGRVLQVRDRVGGDVDRLPGGADLVGYRINGDDARTRLGRPGAEELAHALGGLGGGQDRRRVAVVEDGVQAADVAGLVRVKQWNGDWAGVQGAVHRDEVFQVLGAQDRYAVTRLGDLLQARANSLVAYREFGPVQLAHNAVAFHGEVEEPVGELGSPHLRAHPHALEH